MFTEQIPWMPHSCYVPEKCKPSTRSCITYTEIRECCCDRVLAKRCKYLSYVYFYNDCVEAIGLKHFFQNTQKDPFKINFTDDEITAIVKIYSTS